MRSGTLLFLLGGATGGYDSDRYDPPMTERPNNEALARLYDDAVRRGYEIRHSAENRLITYRKNPWGAKEIVTLVLLGVLTLLIVPIILLFLAVVSPGGQLTTYTVRTGGKVKKVQRSTK